jgi:hypothetical protein
MAIVPADTPPPAWVEQVTTTSGDWRRWVRADIDADSGEMDWRIEQLWRKAEGSLILSEPYITMSEGQIEYTVEEARASAAALAAAAVLLAEVIEQTRELLGAAGQEAQR